MRPIDALAAWWADYQAPVGPLGLSTSHITRVHADVSCETLPALAPAKQRRIKPPTPAEAAAARDALRQHLAGHQARDRPHAGPRALVTLGGSVFTLKAPSWGEPVAGGGKRGEIMYLSASSRRRLLRFLASINMQVVGEDVLFITLTYPEQYPREATVFKRHLQTFLRRLCRHCPEVGGVWRLEPQQRGAPHYHLLVFGATFIHHAWVATEWAGIVNCDHAKHVQAGTRTEKVNSYRGVLAYAAKYICKRPDGEAPLHWGRWWGYFAKANLPIEEVDLPLTLADFYILKRVCRRLLAQRGSSLRATVRQQGLTVFLRSDVALRLVEHQAQDTRPLKVHQGWTARLP